MKKNEIRQAYRNKSNNHTKTQQENSQNKNLQNANKKPMEITTKNFSKRKTHPINLNFASPESVQYNVYQPNNSQQQINADNTVDIWSTVNFPFRYELIQLPDAFKKCYGCKDFFPNVFRWYPCNLVVRHRNRCIQDRATNGQLTYPFNFYWIYYHLNIGHIAQKNSLFSTNPIVYCDMHNIGVVTKDLQYASISERVC